MQVYVVTSVELGWNCVVAVYSGDVSLEELSKRYPDKQGYVVHPNTLETKIEDELSDDFESEMEEEE